MDINLFSTKIIYPTAINIEIPTSLSVEVSSFLYDIESFLSAAV
jgi:hypothetical protein